MISHVSSPACLGGCALFGVDAFGLIAIDPEVCWFGSPEQQGIAVFNSQKARSKLNCQLFAFELSMQCFWNGASDCITLGSFMMRVWLVFCYLATHDFGLLLHFLWSFGLYISEFFPFIFLNGFLRSMRCGWSCLCSSVICQVLGLALDLFVHFFQRYKAGMGFFKARDRHGWFGFLSICGMQCFLFWVCAQMAIGRKQLLRKLGRWHPNKGYSFQRL